MSALVERDDLARRASTAAHLDHALARLGAVRAGIHAQRAADAAGNAVVEGEAVEAGLAARRRRAPCPAPPRRRGSAGLRRRLDAAEARGREPDHDARRRRRRGSGGWSRGRSPSPARRSAALGRKSARSSSSAGWKRSCAGPPTRNQVMSFSERCGSRWPRMAVPREAGEQVESWAAPRHGVIRVVHRGCASRRVRQPRLRRPPPIRPAALPRRQRRQFARQRIGPLRDVAGAEEDDVVARPRELARSSAASCSGAGSGTHVAMTARARGRATSSSRSTPSIGASPAAIDVGDDHRVGVVEAARRNRRRGRAGAYSGAAARSR